jgi:predicted RND superfamily exporter protein
VVEIDTLDEAFPPPERQARRAALAVRLGEQLARIRPDMLDDAGRERLAEGLRLVRAAQPVAIEELPYALVGPFVTQDGRGSILHLRMHETDDANTEVLVHWAAEAREITTALRDAGLEAPLLSENWIAGEIFERVARDGRYLLVGTLVAVFLVLLLDFRRPLVALGVLGAVLLGVGGIAGGMWLAGVQLNFMNAAILPVCVGISLDNAIHVYHRWHEGGPGSIPMVLRHTTSANALASATNLLGFAALALTHHEGLRSVAYLAMIGVTATYVSTTLWFPMVLETLDRRRARALSSPSTSTPSP